MTRINWAVLGVGRFGALHARVLNELPGARLVGLCGRRRELLEQLSGELDVAVTTDDYREMLANADIHAVSITTHWREHAELAEAALVAGKHVFLEKPMAVDSDQCRRLLAAAEQAAGQFMVGHICRFDPRIALAKQAVDEGRLGRIVSMHARRNLPRAPGSLRLDKISPLMGDGIHDADLMMWLTGTVPDRVYARNVRVHNYRYPDLGWAMLEFGERAVGVVETVWCLPPNVPTKIDAVLEVIGTDGKLTVDCGRAGLQILAEDGGEYPDTLYWPQVHGRTFGTLHAELEYFQRRVRDGRSIEIVTPREAAQAVAVVEAAERSAEIGQPVDMVTDFGAYP